MLLGSTGKTYATRLSIGSIFLSTEIVKMLMIEVKYFTNKGLYVLLSVYRTILWHDKSAIMLHWLVFTFKKDPKMTIQGC